jgi:hypothetical protein
MSGRLIILPKKSYCPWNPKNVERVERDEREHREAQARQRQQQAQDVAKERSLALRKHGVDGDGALVQRFSLFEEEERKHHLSLEHELLLGGGRNDAAPVRRDNHHRRHASTTRKGTFGSCQPADATPFYMKVGTTHNEPSQRQKCDLDPMKHFHRHERNHHIADVTTHNGTTLPSQSHLPRVSEKYRNQSGVETERRHKRDQDESSVASASSDTASRKKRRKGKHQCHHDEKKKRRRKEEKKRTRKRHKRGDHESTEKESVDNSIEALRKRRTEREEKERRRSNELRGTNQGKRYLDQYNPHLSNR